VILLIALIAFNCAYAFEFTNLAEVKALRTSSYGNSLIETISLSLQSSGSIDDVQKLLDDLLYKLNKDQEDSDKDWEHANATLNGQISDLTTDINELVRLISVDTADKKRNEDLAATAQTNLNQYGAQKQANLDSLDALEVNRKKDNDLYKQSTQEHNDVINAIGEVVKELSKLTGSISGLGKPAHVEDIAQETRDAAYSAASNAPAQTQAASQDAPAQEAPAQEAPRQEEAQSAPVEAPVDAALATAFSQLTRDQSELMIFAQLATSADQEALAKLIKMLNDLSDATKNSLNSDEAHEAESVNSYNSLKTVLLADNEKLEKLTKEQNDNLIHYQDEVKRLGTKIDEQTTLQVSKEAERAATIKERTDKETQYNTDKAERNNEKTVIARLQKIVKERLASMSKFLRSETGGF